MTLCDAGPLYALVDKKQTKHAVIRKTWPSNSNGEILPLGGEGIGLT